MADHSFRNRAEWISLGISLTLLTGVIGTVVSLWLNPSLKPARFTVELGKARNSNNHYYLPVTVTNEGDETATQVTVEGTLNNDSREEMANTTFDFVPARSDAEGVLIFSSDPSSVVVRVISYQKP
jgi:uncharacterized protein (TIGR02588 family)